ncbi:MAG: type 4a pilus biogenesis protein PilO, partial [Patescibacteria group bacterium]
MTTSDFKKRLFKEIGTAFGVMLILGGILLFFGFSISSLSVKISSMRQEFAMRSASLESIAALRSQYKSAQGYLGVLHNVVPQKDQLIDLSKDIQEVARRGKLEYGFSFINETPRTETNLGSVNFSLSLVGDLTSLINFVKDMRSFKYINSLDSISVTKG